MALQPTFDIRPIREETVEQILLDELTQDDKDAIRFDAEEGELNRDAKWAAILPRLISRLRTDLRLDQDPILLVEEEPDSIDLRIISPPIRFHLHLLRLR